MKSWEWPEKPWTRLHIDHAGPLEGKTLLIVVDAHTSTPATATINKLRTTFSIHGLPQTIVSDNGSAFTSAEFQEFLRQNGIEHVRSPPYHPSSNGLAERAVQTVKEGLKKMLEVRLDQFLFKYRVTPQATTGIALAELLMIGDFGRIWTYSTRRSKIGSSSDKESKSPVPEGILRSKSYQEIWSSAVTSQMGRSDCLDG